MHSNLNDVDFSTVFSLNKRSNLDDFISVEFYFDLSQILSNIDGLNNIDNVDYSNHSKVINTFLCSKIILLYSELSNIITTYSWTLSPFFFEIVNPYFFKNKCVNKLLKNNDDVCIPHIKLILCIGDNIEEEWFVVSIIKKLSEKIPDVIVTVNDNDGQLLLMECAFYIPSWLTPKTSLNRVFLRQGKLLIIPRCYPEESHSNNHDDHNRYKISLEEALSIIQKDTNQLCVAKNTLQKVLNRRVNSFNNIENAWANPKLLVNFKNVLDSIDSSSCFPYLFRILVPIHIAIMLTRFPNIISLALDHLPISKDILIELRKNRNSDVKEKRFFDTCNNHLQYVLMNIRLNRCQFAKLYSLKFKLPMEFNITSWGKELGNTLNDSSTKNSQENGICEDQNISESHGLYREERDLGSKICLALYALYQSKTKNLNSILCFFWEKLNAQSQEYIPLHYYTPTSDFNNCDKMLQQFVTEHRYSDPQVIQYIVSRFQRFLYRLLQSSKYNNNMNMNMNSINTTQSPFISEVKTLIPLYEPFLDRMEIEKSHFEKCIQTISFNTIWDFEYTLIDKWIQSNPFKKNCLCVCSSLQSCAMDNLKCTDSDESFLQSNCFGQLCTVHSEDKSWIYLSHDDINNYINHRTQQDRFSSYIKNKIANRKETHDDQQSTDNTSFPNQGMDELCSNFEDLLKLHSSYKGIDMDNLDSTISGMNLTPNDISNLKKDIPNEFKDLLQDIEENDAILSESDTENASSYETFTSQGDDDFEGTVLSDDNTLDEQVEEMERELLETTQIKNPIDLQANEATTNYHNVEKKVRFSDLSQEQITQLFNNFIQKSKEEELPLEPGPASMLMSYLNNQKK